MSIRLVLTFATFAMMMAACLQAQDMKASIPFGFQVGTVELPAGEYTFVKDDSGILRVHAADKHGPIASAVTAGTDRPAEANEKPAAVQFNRYGGRYFLATVWYGPDPVARVVLKSNREKELAHLNRPETTTIAVHKP